MANRITLCLSIVWAALLISASVYLVFEILAIQGASGLILAAAASLIGFAGVVGAMIYLDKRLRSDDWGDQ